ncbi:TM0106 family RecB-like putative nuclease [Chryseolinea sp. H1M3-3]|uniref:TM0106 family RecB-like putative nuclease n=1 Tax=Chryseolinea sp. H1M3-3 TaxID=3034144 RepID=UPI0023ECE451|nr:TM0106 family RecB-like putative nuclease [Chryseolinea sp. H1M3-3]
MKYVTEIFQLSATDLSNHLGCHHLTQLNRLVAQEKIKKPAWYDPSLEILIQRGQEHEAAYVQHLIRKGLSVVTLRGQSLTATTDAMQKGADVIVQARLDHEQWMGYADILLKVPGASKFGNWAYEVQDTKLAQNTKAATILQLCLYTELLSELQGNFPEKMHVVKPGENFPSEEYRYAEFQAYYRQVKKNFERIMNGPGATTYPDPVEHCSICAWWQVCDRKRHSDDHLSLVAGIRSLHMVELQRQQITTLEQFANVERLEKPERGNKETFLRKQSQAKIQLKGRQQNQLLFEHLPEEAGRGLHRLPEPNAGDIYFDIEGDAFYEEAGLEYLFGYAYHDNGALVYKKIWASNRGEEKKAFSEFMQFVAARWKRYPRMYVYHFAPYEPTAIKRLARVHALFEKETDVLLRAERFVDIHAVFKEALLASVETYSLKELEKFTGYTRNVVLHEASSARKLVEIALELHAFDTLSPATIKTVEDYNEDDCLATEALHRWLEKIRQDLIQSGKQFQRPELKTGEANENTQQLDTRSAALYEALTKRLPEDRLAWDEEHEARWLLAHQLDYFRREDKSAWWEFFRVHELEYEALLDERKAIAGLRFVEELPKGKREKNPTHRYTFPPQEVNIDEDDELIEVKGEKIGTVKAISLENYTIDIKKTEKSIGLHPASVHVLDVIRAGSLETSLMDLAAAIDEEGLGRTWPYYAAKDLLMRRKPKMLDGHDGAYLLQNEDLVHGAIRLALSLNRSYLAIQGPPGTGKTYTGASMIFELAKAGKKIGVTAVSHKVIRNLAMATLRLAGERSVKINFVHKVNEKSDEVTEGIVEVDKSDKALQALKEGKIVCGTAWLWAEDSSRESLDYLFVDEAGQMSLSHVLAASRATQNLILLGDPQQLEQPQKGSHPEGSDVAALSYILEGHPTMPEGKGLFLGVTRRLHPAICRFTSEIFYEDRLTSLAGLENQIISGDTTFDGAGLFYISVSHSGNQNKSPEEIKVITSVVENLLRSGKWTDNTGVTRPLHKKDILIVAPFNAQVSALREKLPDIEIGTVDKFQGQEAPVVIYSMTCSTPEDAPRGMAFLYSPNRLNVATSRAKSICILIASPQLLAPDCRTIDQMRWANALCRYREMATEVKI